MAASKLNGSQYNIKQKFDENKTKQIFRFDCWCGAWQENNSCDCKIHVFDAKRQKFKLIIKRLMRKLGNTNVFNFGV